MALEILSCNSCASAPSTGVVRGDDVAQRLTDTSTSTRLPATDAVELSTRLQDAHRAQQIVQESPEVREDLVQDARQMLAAGELTLESEALAERLISEQLR